MKEPLPGRSGEPTSDTAECGTLRKVCGGIWQDTDYVLGYFGRRVRSARAKYLEYVREGIGRGRRPELAGGGLLRSLGAWNKAKELREGSVRLKGDERILGDTDFVLEALEASGEKLERKYRLKAEGYTWQKLVDRVGELLGIEPEVIWSAGKYRNNVRRRSLFCYWAVRELGWNTTESARRMGISPASKGFLSTSSQFPRKVCTSGKMGRLKKRTNFQWRS